MDFDGLEKELNRLGCVVERNISGAALSAFGSGGKVKFFACPENPNAAVKTLAALKNVCADVKIIGNGTDTLISEAGFGGTLIGAKLLKGTYFNGNKVYCSAGESVSALASALAKRGLAGGEFLSGIPAQVGGGIINNCGAFGGEISDICEYVDVATESGIERVYSRDLAFSYRFSALKKREKTLILGAQFAFFPSDKHKIAEKIADLRRKRREKQPIEPSLGSVFKKITDEKYRSVFPDIFEKFGSVPAAVFIEACGLKGFCRGGAAFSEKHCNFIVNKGGATSNDYLALVDLARGKVYNKYNIALEPEIVTLGV